VRRPEIAEEAGSVGTDEGVSVAAAEEADPTAVVEAAGRFRIYLGAAAGVGKTYAMLSEGHRRLSRGADVVIGFVECHGRRLTEQLIEGLEAVPRKVVDYRGSRLLEMDLDAVLRRHPKIALVDELAHTNVPGSGRHEKRWQDVEEILAAGISVITTVNIQHLESIADEVEHMTGAPVRERVPDWVVRKADQIELVDSSPELAADVGARWHETEDDDPARAIARFAREHQITQIVIGSSQRRRWQQLAGGGSHVVKVIREAGAAGIDVHVIARRELPPAET
jgi:two-component system sensor histidine kinase KdpD